MRILRPTGLLWLLVGAEALLMQMMEFFVFRRFSGGSPSLDLRWAGFTAREASDWLHALGRQGAEAVIVWHYLTFDLLFPVLLGMAFASTILLLGSRLPRFAVMSPAFRLCFALVLSLPYVFFDYAQNWAVVQLLREPFEVLSADANLASALNVLKFVFGALPVAVIALFALAGNKGGQAGSDRRL